MTTFDRPFSAAAQRDRFSDREVGITHPDNNSYIKICDNGNIEMMLSAGFGIIMDAASRSINLYADSIVMHTKSIDGFRWNRLSFNSRATKYTEPTLVANMVQDIPSLFDGVVDLVGSGKTIGT